MADCNSLIVLSIFDAGARMRCRTELVCLAAHLYHRFFRVKQDTSNYDLYTFAAASLKLAHWFFERDYNSKELCVAMTNIIHGPGQYLDDKTFKNLEHSIDLAAQVIAINIDYQVNFKDTKLATPGDLAARAARQRNLLDVVPVIRLEEEDEFEEVSDDEEAEAAQLLSKNDKYQISSHRFLVHYLKSIKTLVDTQDICHLTKIANTAWSLLCDLYWSPVITQRHGDHWACVCLMMAIEIWREDFEDRNNESSFWKLINRRWNLIFCDNLSNEHVERDIIAIVDQYQEFERVLQQELNTYVIDPRCSN